MEALMIGVSGLRGTVGGTLSPAVALRMASAFAAWLKETQQPRNGRPAPAAMERTMHENDRWEGRAGCSGTGFDECVCGHEGSLSKYDVFNNIYCLISVGLK